MKSAAQQATNELHEEAAFQQANLGADKSLTVPAIELSLRVPAMLL
jgi:hypothetical protein